MDNQIDAADFVLLVCTEVYRRRVMGQEEPGKGLGVRWEGKLIYNRIYNDRPSGSRFVPILLEGAEPAHIPNPLQDHQRYHIVALDLKDAAFDPLPPSHEPATHPPRRTGSAQGPTSATTTATVKQ